SATGVGVGGGCAGAAANGGVELVTSEAVAMTTGGVALAAGVDTGGGADGRIKGATRATSPTVPTRMTPPPIPNMRRRRRLGPAVGCDTNTPVLASGGTVGASGILETGEAD